MERVGEGLRLRVVLFEPVLPPPQGLCLEASLLERAKPVLAVWRHGRSVIVGRSTRLREEVDCSTARVLGVPVYRRRSGGGAVYHDPGNINISLVLPGRYYPGDLYRLGTSLVRRVLSLLGLPSHVENEADIVVGGWKVSGGAALIARRASLYHATLLVEADTSLLHAIVRPRLDLVQTGRVTPAKYRPANISSMSPRVGVREALGAIEDLALAMGWPIERAAPPTLGAEHCESYPRECAAAGRSASS